MISSTPGVFDVGLRLARKARATVTRVTWWCRPRQLRLLLRGPGAPRAATPQESRASIKSPDPSTSSKIDPVNAVLRPSGTGPLGGARDSPCAPRRRPVRSWRAARLFINRDVAFAYSSGRQSPGARRILLIPMDNRILLVTPRRQPIECRALLAMAAGEVGGGGGVP